jgi:hypothetical protein
MQFATGILHLIPHGITIVAVVMLNSKKSTPEAMLMLIGSIVSVIISAGYTIGIPLLVEMNGYQSIQSYLTLFGMVGILGALLFAIGFLMYVKKT